MPKPQRLPNIDEQSVLEELRVCVALPALVFRLRRKSLPFMRNLAKYTCDGL
jgi:hypothetical protein